MVALLLLPGVLPLEELPVVDTSREVDIESREEAEVELADAVEVIGIGGRAVAATLPGLATVPVISLNMVHSVSL